MDQQSPSKDPPHTPTLSTPIRTGAQRVRNQYESPQPYTGTRQLGSPSTPASHHVQSVPPSPCPGLTEKQIKQLQKAFEKTNTKVELTHDVLGLLGHNDPRDELVRVLGEWADRRPNIRTFSRLTAEDYTLLCSKIENEININKTILRDTIPDHLIPAAFLSMLHISRLVSSRNNETGTRKIINLFLDTAVYIARKVFSEPRLVVHHEWETEPTNVPEIGIVSGPLDYVTSRAAGHLDMGTFQILYY